MKDQDSLESQDDLMYPRECKSLATCMHAKKTKSHGTLFRRPHDDLLQHIRQRLLLRQYGVLGQALLLLLLHLLRHVFVRCARRQGVEVCVAAQCSSIANHDSTTIEISEERAPHGHASIDAIAFEGWLVPEVKDKQSIR